MPIEPADLKAKLLQFVATPFGGQAVATGEISFVGDNVKMMKMFADSVGQPNSAYNEKKPIWDQWEVFMNSYIESAPDSLKSVK